MTSVFGFLYDNYDMISRIFAVFWVLVEGWVFHSLYEEAVIFI